VAELCTAPRNPFTKGLISAAQAGWIDQRPPS
jgi:hypothetical protein